MIKTEKKKRQKDHQKKSTEGVEYEKEDKMWI